MQNVLDLYVERRYDFREEEKTLENVIKKELNVQSLNGVRRIYHYKIENGNDYLEDKRFKLIFSEPQTDIILQELYDDSDFRMNISSLPGQYNQREDSAMQAMALLKGKREKVFFETVYLFYGDLTEENKKTIKKYMLNPVENCLTEDFVLAEETEFEVMPPVFKGFIEFDNSDLEKFRSAQKLAMSMEDLKFMQKYFKETEMRDPTDTEIRVIDTYWSDHCRHTTFNTELKNVQIDDDEVSAAYSEYMSCRSKIYGEVQRPVTLMDLATIGAKSLKRDGTVKSIDESEEINACSVNVDVETSVGTEQYLYQFKNETHNHPTEIEPFGGAATCLGGAIRDPLSGRAYVYQGMRITGASDPRVPINETLPGKLPQKKICQLAAAGFSSYGNQIGMATGFVEEIYHPGYMAKRLELGAVVGACPKKNVVRKEPKAGDIVVLVGGRTGRDGCGGATGSSVSHDKTALTTRGAEVQKGNAVEQRKLQRFFRNGSVSRMIIRCNDFGAGGVSVSIGELAEGLKIFLDRVPKKYENLTATEIAISESQERMSCVIHPENKDEFIKAAEKENLEATVVAEVTDDKRLKMYFNDAVVLDMTREFVDSSGAKRTVDVCVGKSEIKEEQLSSAGLRDSVISLFSDINIAGKHGLVEMFDSSIGSASVLNPFGGKNQETPSQVMAALIPHEKYRTKTASVFAYGFDPYDMENNELKGAYNSVLSSVTKLIASGAKPSETFLSLQEYFPSLGNDPKKWGKPFKALLGALTAQLDMSCPAIGGKDSMSGTFENIEVPSTLVSFATCVCPADSLISPEFKDHSNFVYIIDIPMAKNRVRRDAFEKFREKFYKLVKEGKIISAWSIEKGGALEGICKMALGNDIGFEVDNKIDLKTLKKKRYGSIIVESECEIDGLFIGKTISEPVIRHGNEEINLDEIREVDSKVFEDVYPTKCEADGKAIDFPIKTARFPNVIIGQSKPKLVIPVFPGTNCEFDTEKAATEAGASVKTVLIRNKRDYYIEESIVEMQRELRDAHMMVIPGGFSFGDEPDGSAKFIAAFFREERMRRSVEDLLKARDGLILGICNGFQALIKLGLVPFGEIVEPSEKSPTLTFNKIHRHQAKYVSTKIVSNSSPWLARVRPGDIHSIPISHGEGRLVATENQLSKWAENGQIATQYVDNFGNASMDIKYNPNGSAGAVEGLLSPDGKVFGKMGHSERFTKYVGINISGNREQMIFESGVDYFTCI